MPNPSRARSALVTRVVLVVLAAMALLIAACAVDDVPIAATIEPSDSRAPADSPATESETSNEADSAAPAPTSEPTTEQPIPEEPAETERAEATGGESSPEPSAPLGDPTELTLTSIGDFDSPGDIIVRPGDDRVFVVEVSGTITAVTSATTAGALVLDVSDKTLFERERGLLGAAFHPTADLLYVHYSDRNGDSVIAEFAVGSSGMADPGSERTVMIVGQPFNNHNGGEVDFGPDGYLYLAFGDGGRSGDPNRAALDLASPLGKILRIDPQASADEPFSVPGDNPFVDEANADPRIWSYGLRNPWKFSFDSATGDLWIADVGQDQWEEVNAARSTNGLNAGRGVSFGWSAFEGFAPFNGDQPADGHADPFFVYDRSNGKCSISGGAVSRDPLVPELNGWYVYGDFCTGEIFGIDGSGASGQQAIQLAQVNELVAIATGPDGALYAASFGGSVYRLG